MPSPVIISLTTIPSRLDLIAPTLADLLAQSARIEEVRLTIPRRYRRFPDARVAAPALPRGVRLCLTDEDWGPATKILPAAAELAGQDVEIIACDDDQRYDPGWAARLLAARAQHPRSCIVGLGYDLEHRRRGLRYFPRREGAPMPRAARIPMGTRYRLKRALSLGQWKPRRYTASGHVDVLQGYRGLMIRPDFLPPEAWAIPDVLWTVDDPWLSGQLTRNGVPIWMVAEGPRGGMTEAGARDGLRQMVYKNHGRHQADTLTLEYFRHHYGLWPDSRPPECDTAGLAVPPIPAAVKAA